LTLRKGRAERVEAEAAGVCGRCHDQDRIGSSGGLSSMTGINRDRARAFDTATRFFRADHRCDFPAPGVLAAAESFAGVAESKE
jgi:hypothetical protein